MCPGEGLQDPQLVGPCRQQWKSPRKGEKRPGERQGAWPGALEVGASSRQGASPVSTHPHQPHSHLGTSASTGFCSGPHPALSPRVIRKGSLRREESGRGALRRGTWDMG